MFPFIVREDKVEEFLEMCGLSGLSKEQRQELIEHAKMIREVKQMENYNDTPCGCCPSPVEQTSNQTNTSYAAIAYQENVELQKKFADSEREQNRLRYMAIGYSGLIAMTKDADLIAKAAEIAVEANKLY